MSSTVSPPVRYAGFAQAAGGTSRAPRFRFGVVTDPQYAPLPPWKTRYFANSLDKLAAAIAAFNCEDLQFVVTLGDLVEEGWENFAPALRPYAALRHPHVLMLGNHDYKVLPDQLDAVRQVAAGEGRAYYDFPGGGHRFVVLDGNEVSLFANPPGSANHAEAEARLAWLKAAGAANAQDWNGGISDTQFTWLQTVLDQAVAAGERVILFCHYPVYPANDHNLFDDVRVVELLSGHDNAVLFLSGHNHVGNYGHVGGTHFVNLKGLVETPDAVTYAIVDVHDDRIVIHGSGLEESRVLAL
jgi:predicted phosphodiesterase